MKASNKSDDLDASHTNLQAQPTLKGINSLRQIVPEGSVFSAFKATLEKTSEAEQLTNMWS